MRLIDGDFTNFSTFLTDIYFSTKRLFGEDRHFVPTAISADNVLFESFNVYLHRNKCTYINFVED